MAAVREALVEIEYLRMRLSFDPDTGIFRWKTPFGTKVKPGDKMGHVQGYGRIKIDLDGKQYMAHRLAWFYVYGKWPQSDIDHINGDPSDNRICNLREATDSQNLANSKKPITNKSGKKGVSWHGGAGKWQAHIRVRGENRYLGLFGTVAEAHSAYAAAAIESNGDFARLE